MNWLKGRPGCGAQGWGWVAAAAAPPPIWTAPVPALTVPVGSTPCSSHTTCERQQKWLLSASRVVSDRAAATAGSLRPPDGLLAVHWLARARQQGPQLRRGVQLGGRSDPRPQHSPPRTWRQSGCRTGRPAVGGRGSGRQGSPIRRQGPAGRPPAGQLPGAGPGCRARSRTPRLLRAGDLRREGCRGLTWTATISLIAFKLRTAGGQGRPSGDSGVIWGGRGMGSGARRRLY